MIKANIIYTFNKYDQETITLDLNLKDLNNINQVVNVEMNREVKFISHLIQNSFNDYEKYLKNFRILIKSLKDGASIFLIKKIVM